MNETGEKVPINIHRRTQENGNLQVSVLGKSEASIPKADQAVSPRRIRTQLYVGSGV